jgi:hypothetical protein
VLALDFQEKVFGGGRVFYPLPAVAAAAGAAAKVLFRD